MKSVYQTEKILKTLVHSNSLSAYKAVGSSASLPNQVAARKLEKGHRQGALFVVRNKEHFDINGKTKGYIVTSKESLIEDAEGVTHFTPNLYRQYRHTNKTNRKYISGYTEDNLLCIHAFSVEVDNKDHSVEEIVMTCMDESIGIPTLIVETPRGYHLHFVLDKPFYLSDKKQFLTLAIAKRITRNIKESLKSLEIDMFCNDFSFFRVPTAQNTVFYRPEACYSLEFLIDYSRRQDNDKERSLFVIPNSNNSEVKLTKSDWYNALVSATKVKGEKGQIGRNNLLFTIALTCYADGWDKQRTYNELDECNSRFNLGLKQIKSIAESAYSGKYNGPNKEYIEALLELYCNGTDKFNINYGASGWYKHRKNREDRKRSHYEEIELDIVQFIASKTNSAEAYLTMSQNELCKSLNIARSSLNVILKSSKTILKKVYGKGRNAITAFTTVSVLIQSIIKAKKDTRHFFLDAVMEEIRKEYKHLFINPAAAILLNFFSSNSFPIKETTIASGG